MSPLQPCLSFGATAGRGQSHDGVFAATTFWLMGRCDITGMV